MLVGHIKAKFSDGTLTPLENLNLEKYNIKDGDEVIISIIKKAISPEERLNGLKALAGAWEENAEYWDDFLEYVYKAREEGSRSMDDFPKL